MTTNTFPVTGPIDLNCQLGYGTVTVHAVTNATEATVTLATKDPASDLAAQTTVELKGSTLHIAQPNSTLKFSDVLMFLRGRKDELEITVTVPEGTNLQIASRGSEIVLDGRVGGADIATGFTNLTFDEIDGNLRFRSGSGQARGRRVAGSTELKSGSGGAKIGEVGSVEMGCASGVLELGVAHGPVRMRTGSGTATIGSAESDVDFVSGSGGLTVGLPAGKKARVDALTGSGRVDTELPVDDVPPVEGTPSSIRARTGSGDIRFHRAVAA